MNKLTIRQARALTGLSQEEVAKELGVERETFWRYENYKHPMLITTAYVFARLVSKDLNEIQFFKEEE